jgi:Uma2 family endonuclease
MCVGATLPTSRRAEHHMGMPASVRRRWTRADVLGLMEATPFHWPRYEVVDGELLVTPAPGIDHQLAIGELFVLLKAYVEEMGIGHVLFSPSDVELKRGGLVQPDLYVMSREETIRARRANKARRLLLAVEVLSPGSERADRGRKRELYQARVPCYWLFDLEARHVEVWLPGRPRPTIAVDRLEWHPAGASRPFELDLRRYFAKVAGQD